jgi:ABC-type transport system involved in multi-copper enzyme maturation permease subunit
VVGRAARPTLARTFRGVWLLTYPAHLAPGALLSTAGLLVLLGLLAIPSVRHGETDEFLSWATNFFLCTLVPAIAFLAGAGALRDEMKPVAVDYLHTRPARRDVVGACKCAAQYLALQPALVLALAVVVGAGLWRGVPSAFAAAPALLTAQAFTTAAFLGLGALIGALTRRYLVFGLLYAAVVEVGIGAIPTQLSRLSLTQHTRTIVAALDGGGAVATALGSSLVLGTVAIVGAVSAATLLRHREMVGAAARDN